MATKTMVLELPGCDVCKAEFPASDPNPATVDGKMTTGQWAYMCETHFEDYGVGLGTGQGQRLILAIHESGEEPDGYVDPSEIPPENTGMTEDF